MKSELTLAFNEIAEHSKLKREIILEALENALVTAYRKAMNSSTAQHVVAKVDLLTGAVKIYAEKEVVESVLDDRTEVALDPAHEVDPQAQAGDMVTVESTPKDFGRIAAQAAKQVIIQKLREAERESQYQEYVQREGDIINGTVQAVSPQSVTLGLGRAEATLPRNQMVPGERYHAHQKVRAYVLEVRKTTRGPQIIVSRSHKNMLRRLLEYEVPEIYNGQVEIKSIAREPGHRSKVAVAARQEGVDPVGACVGMRGVRIQSIVKELNDEKIDVIEWNPEQASFISKALSPARVTSVYLNDDPLSGRTAMVVVPDDQLSLAIGREGQNARLAAKLTGWRIDIKSLTEAANEAFKLLNSDPALAAQAQATPELFASIEAILARKAEGRPVSPEDYQVLARLVEQVEKQAARARQGELAAKAEKVAAIKAGIPAAARQMPLSQASLSDAILRSLAEAEFRTVGDVLEQLALDDNRLRGVDGIGDKELDAIKSVLGQMTFPEPEPEPVAVLAPEPIVGEPASETAAPAAPESADEVAVAGEAVAAETEEEATEEVDAEEKDDDDPTGKKKDKKKGKKKGAVEITFDEDLGMFVTRKKRKAGRVKDEIDLDE